ncbi:hypothetical protein U9M48_015343 [Paspalum notatum var. saurae]|uniref:non-specific serine/threonine protein kinase n=1 Tax=Paspalum notatum var. saurae TaxID=547442 RepID=A0AAQ3T6C3_PASNO
MPARAGTPTFWFGDRVYISDLPSAALVLFSDRLCITEAWTSCLWSSSVAGDDDGPAPPMSAAAAVLLGNGNFVVRDQANSSRILWQSFDCPGDTLLAGTTLGLDGATGANVSMTYTTSGMKCI